MACIKSGLRLIEEDLDSARTLLDLQRANVRALAFSIRTNFAIIWVLSVATKVRHWLGFRQAARVITHAMMARYAEIAARPKLADRLAGLDQWLELYGHRGPLESDPCRPRFSEMREELRESLSAGPAPAPRPQPQPSRLVAALGRPLFVGDEVREWFRDQLMHWWGRLRLRILEEARLAVIAGHLDAEDDVFFLRSEDLAASPATWRDRVAYRKTRIAWAERLDLPTTASRDELQTCIAERDGREDEPDPGLYRGIGLGVGPVVGTVVVGTSVADLLNGRTLPEAAVLVAECLEPSWAVLFPRFAAVVADLGGELSHAAILLREAGIPSVVNARGAFRALKDGDTVRVDPADGLVEVVSRAASAEDLDRFSLLNGSS